MASASELIVNPRGLKANRSAAVRRDQIITADDPSRTVGHGFPSHDYLTDWFIPDEIIDKNTGLGYCKAL